MCYQIRVYVLCSTTHLFYWCTLSLRVLQQLLHSLGAGWPRACMIKQIGKCIEVLNRDISKFTIWNPPSKHSSVCSVYSKINVIYVGLFTSTVSPIAIIIVVEGIFREWRMENVNRGCIVIQLLLANHNSIHSHTDIPLNLRATWKIYVQYWRNK